MKIEIMSRKAMQELLASGIPPKTAVISFHDPEYKHRKPDPPIDYTGKCERVFQIAVHDIDIEILEDFGLTFQTYLPEADELAGFIISAEKDGFDIICQCEYGQSRSAACAAAIKEYFYHSGIEVFADYRYYPNQLIFNKVYTALKNTK